MSELPSFIPYKLLYRKDEVAGYIDKSVRTRGALDEFRRFQGNMEKRENADDDYPVWVGILL